MEIMVVNIIARGLSGISQVFYTSYLIVWCVQYRKEKYKTIMITIIQLSSAVGIIRYGLGSLISNFGKILCNKIFLFTLLLNSLAFFTMRVIFYWGDKYMDKVFEVSESARFKEFSGLVLLGPILGILFGGIVWSHLGGYGKRKVMVFVIISEIVGSPISITKALYNNYIVFILISWLFYFLFVPQFLQKVK